MTITPNKSQIEAAGLEFVEPTEIVKDTGPKALNLLAQSVVDLTAKARADAEIVEIIRAASITGPGRPDTPATTGGIITGSEPVGCAYISTDGAGVGAWVWRKRPTGWEVTDGDTGWRRVDSLVEELFTLTAPRDRGIYIRRTGWRVTFAVSGSTATVEQTSQILPAGFSPDTVRFQMSIQALRQPSVQVQLLADSAARLMLVPNTTPVGTRVGGYLEWSTNDQWPTALPGDPA